MDKELKALAKKIVDVTHRAPKKETYSYDTQATVTRVEKDIAWVHIPGGIVETPVKLSIQASTNDKVMVRLADGDAWITGNISRPPTDDSAIDDIKTDVDVTQTKLDNLRADVDVSQTKIDDIQIKVLKVQPAGSIEMYAGPTNNIPDGWLLCDGHTVSRTDYQALFNAIGTTWGSGNGTTTFNLPDLRGRAPIGVGKGTGLSNRSLTDEVGSEYIQAHEHNFTNPSISRTTDVGVTVNNTNSTHSHALKRQQLGVTSGSANRYFASGSDSGGGTQTDGAHTHGTKITQPTFKAENGAVTTVKGVTTGTAGNMQPSIAVNFIIFAG